MTNTPLLSSAHEKWRKFSNSIHLLIFAATASVTSLHVQYSWVTDKKREEFSVVLTSFFVSFIFYLSFNVIIPRSLVYFSHIFLHILFIFITFPAQTFLRINLQYLPHLLAWEEFEIFTPTLIRICKEPWINNESPSGGMYTKIICNVVNADMFMAHRGLQLTKRCSNFRSIQQTLIDLNRFSEQFKALGTNLFQVWQFIICNSVSWGRAVVKSGNLLCSALKQLDKNLRDSDARGLNWNIVSRVYIH